MSRTRAELAEAARYVEGARFSKGPDQKVTLLAAIVAELLELDADAAESAGTVPQEASWDERLAASLDKDLDCPTWDVLEEKVWDKPWWQGVPNRFKYQFTLGLLRMLRARGWAPRRQLDAERLARALQQVHTISAHSAWARAGRLVNLMDAEEQD